MTQLAALTYTPEVRADQAVQQLDRLARAAGGVGAAVSETETRLTRGSASFSSLSSRYNDTERAALAVERATRRHNQALEDAARLARQEGVEQQRLAATIASIQRAKEQAAQAAVRGFTAEAQAAALSRAGYAQLAAQAQATATAQASLNRVTGEGAQGLSLLSAAASGAGGALGSLGSALTSPAAAIAALTAAATLGVRQIALLGDAYTNSMNRLQAATGTAQGAAQVYSQLVQISMQTGAAIGDSANAFQRFAIAARGIGATNEQVLTLTRTLQQAALVAGAGTQEMASTTLQLGQALASGTLQGDELRAILEAMPTLAEAIARELGVSVGQLRQMGSEGQLTSERVFNAILRASEGINRQFDQMTPTMSRAFGQLGAAMTDFVGRLDRAVGLSRAIAEAAGAAARAVSGLGVATGLGDPLDVAIAGRNTAQSRLSALDQQLPNAEAALNAPMPGGTRATMRRNVEQLRAQREEALRELERFNLQVDELERERLVARLNGEAEADVRRQQAQRQQAQREFNELRNTLDRERRLREDHQKALQVIAASGATAEEATRLRELADRRLADGLRGLEGAARSAGAAAREAASDFGMLRQSASGLLVAGPGDERAIAEIQRLARGTALDPARFQRETREAEQSAQRAAQELQRFEQSSREAFGRIGENALDRIGQGVVSAFVSGERAALDFGSLSRSVIASVATDLIRLAAINPFTNAVFGTTRPTLGGALGGAGGAAAAAGGGASLQQAGGFLGLGRLFGGGGGSFLTTPGVFANTGIGFLDRGLNATLSGSPFIGSVDAAGNFLPFAGNYSASGAFQGMGGAFTVGNALGAGASILGGGFSLYQGIQRGGIGGAVQGLGGVAGLAGGAGMLAGGLGIGGAIGGALAAAAPILGPVALIAGIIGSLLPGQRPSGREQGAVGEFGTNDFIEAGLTGNRFSPQQRAQAVQIARSIMQQEDAIASRVGFSAAGQIDVRVIGGRGSGPGVVRGRVGSGGDFFETPNTEDGLRSFAESASSALFRAFQDAARDNPSQMGGIVRGSSSLEDLAANVEWFETTYKALTDAADRTSAFAQQVAALVQPFDDAIARARQLGLAEDVLTQKRAEAVARAEEERERTTRGIWLGILQRGGQAGAGTDLANMMHQIANDNEIAQVREQLEALGHSAADVTTTLDALRRVQAQELTRRGAPEALQALSGLRDFSRSLTFSEFSPLSSTAQYGAAAASFREIAARAQQGDAAAIRELQGASQQFLASSRAVFGSGVQSVRDFEAVTAAISGVAALSEDMLTGSFFAETLKSQMDRLVDEVRSLRTELAQVRLAPARLAA